MPPTLYLLDGHALAYRTYYALSRGTTTSFTTKAGEPTAGVYGFTSVLLRIYEQENPDFLAVAFDTGKTFRDDLFPAYKGTREKMPDDLITQMTRLRQLVDAFSIPRLEVEGYEADDVLGSVARRAAASGMGVKIITGDRDLLQLVDERIIVNLPGKTLSDSKDYRASDVIEYLGVRPDQVVDYKALVGDKSDNIPGVMGVGEKTAITLLKDYDTLDGVYAHLDELSANLRLKLENGRDSAYLSQKLATIITSLEIPLDLEKARPDAFEPRQVESLFRELEFRSLINRLTNLEKQYGKEAPKRPQQQLSFLQVEEKSVKPPSALASTSGDISAEATGMVQTETIDTPDALAALVQQLQQARMISFDTETTSTNQMLAKLVGISLAVDETKGYYIPVGHQPGFGPQLPLQDVLNALRGPLTDPHIPKVGHNLKYDFVVLARNGLRVQPLAFDTMIAEWLSNPISRNLGLKNLAWVRLDIKMTQIEELIGKGKDQITMDQVPIQQAAPYAAADAAITMRLVPVLQADLDACNATQLMERIEAPLITVLADMEMAGISLDRDYLGQMSDELARRMGDLEGQVYQIAGEPFNLNSTQQLSRVLFERLRLSPPGRSRKTSSGHYSTSADILEALRGEHQIVDLILEYRELSKLKSTYLDALPLEINPSTGRVHTSYSQTGAVTGRLASSEPNLQNIPIRSEIGRRVRRAFIARDGFQLLSVDYSQVELRLAAHMSGDPAMIAAFEAGQDIHAATAAAILGVPIQQVTKDQRRDAKAINFGLIYGMSPFGLTRTTSLTLAEAENFVAAYFKQFPGVKQYLDGMRLLAGKQGYVETLLGRRRYFPGLKDPRNFNTRNREEREAINAPIQGTAADIMKLAMLHVPPALAQAGLSGKMLLQVHDELVLECPEAEIKPTASIIVDVMENAYKLVVPLRADARSGPNWDELQLIA